MALVLHIPKKQARVVAAVAIIMALGAAAGVVGAATTGEAGTSERALAAASGDLSRIDPMQGPPGQQPPPPEQAGAQGTQDPAQQTEPPQGDPTQQAGVVPPPAVQQELLTPEERAALALVEQIIRDQEGVLMGTGFQYDPGDRPDPFRSPLGGGDGGDVVILPGQCPGGRLDGFRISEVVLKAIASAQGRRHAMITGPNQKAYFLEVGTELCDGHVSDITPTAVVFEQFVQDMARVRRSREVTKQLTTDSGGGQTP